jgi:amino acid adenylation domain-containing protein
MTNNKNSGDSALNFQGRVIDSWRDLTLHQLFEEQVRKIPNNICISCNNDRLSYAELNDKANKIANYLNKNIFSPSKIAVCIERSIESIAIMLGILKTGNAYVPLDPNYPPEFTHFIVENSEARVLITQDKYLGRFENIKTQIFTTEFLSNEVNLEKATLESQNQVSSNNLAVILYTSGTTSKPKGVCLNHQGLVNRIMWMYQAFQINSYDHVLNKTSVCFDISIWEIFLPLVSGAVLVCAGADVPKNSEELVKLIQHENITIIHFVPQMLKYFLETENVEECSSLRHVFVSGDVFYFQNQKKFFGKLNCELHNLYGPTEASIDVTHWCCQRDSELDFVPIGKPIANTQIYILDDNLQITEIDKIGQIYIGGDCLAQGYVDKKLTGEYFIIHPKYGRLYRTGDLAKFMPDGNLAFICRNDRQIKLGGYRVELSAIEEAIASSLGIGSVAVTYNESTPGFKQIIAYLVINNNIGAEECVNQLLKYLETKLPVYMLPSIFAVVGKLPLTRAFKVDYLALPKTVDLIKLKEGIYCST